MNLEKTERLLTENERKAILDAYAGIKKSNFVIIFGVGLLIYLIVSLLWGFAWSGTSCDIEIILRQSFYCFLLIFCGTSLWAIKHFWNLQIVIKRVKANTMYAKEAIYEKTTGKYNWVYLEMYKNGKLKYDGYNVLVREPLQKGDKVIVLQMRGKAWVYKARA